MASFSPHLRDLLTQAQDKSTAKVTELYCTADEVNANIYCVFKSFPVLYAMLLTLLPTYVVNPDSYFDPSSLKKINKMNVFQLSPSVSTFIHSVPFQPDTDNRSNFSSDKAFHIFKKQRYISAFVHFIEVNCFKLQTQCCLSIDTV